MQRSADPFVRVTWTDKVTGCHGYAVIDRLVDGISRGGIRMRSGCTPEEVHGLAAVMTNKYGVLNLPSGGAKGGIDFDPHDRASHGVLKRYVLALRPIFDEWWSAGEDLGVTQDDLDQAFVEAGLRTASHATLKRLSDPAAAGRARAAGVAVKVGDVSLPDMIGGYGVAEAAAAAAEHMGIVLGESTAFIQGFGSMGGASARFLAEKGVRIVGLADANGVVANTDGLDVETLLKTRNSFGEIDRKALRKTDVRLPGADWLSISADILVPAALGGVIDARNSDAVRSRLVVEAANMPTTEEARSKLNGRGVVVIPDFVANSAAIAWWWAIMREEIPADAQAAFAHVSRLIRPIVKEILTMAQSRKITPYEASVAVARMNLDRFDQRDAPESVQRQLV